MINKLIKKYPRALLTLDYVLNFSLIAILLSLVIFSVFSTSLLIFDNLSWLYLLMIALPVTVVVLVAVASLLRLSANNIFDKKSRVERVVCLIVLMLGVGAWGLLNMKYSSEHVFVNRDPGIYTLGALHLSENDNLNISSRNDFGKYGSVSSSAVGVSEIDQNEMYFQGSHLLPALVGLGGRVVGTDNVYHLNVLFGCTALLAMFFFASRMMRPIWALGATASMAVAMPMLYFSRDMYTEPLAATFTFTGLGVLWLAVQLNNRLLWFLAGITIGAACLTRIDGYIAIAATLAFVTCYLAFSDTKRRKALISATLFSIGAFITGVLGWLDLLLLSSGYLFDLTRQFSLQMAVLLLAIIFGVVIVTVSWKTKYLKKIDRILRPNYIGMIALATAIITLLFASRQFWEQSTNHLGRNYNELAPLWLGWYLGDTIVTLGIIGASLTVYYALVKKKIVYVIPATAVLLTSIIYLTSANIAPDQVWASRRLLPVIMPGFTILAFFTLQVISDFVISNTNLKSVYRIGIQLTTVAILIVQPLMVSKPMLLHSQYRQLSIMKGFCEKIPSDSGVVWLGTGKGWAVQATEEICGVTSAGLALDGLSNDILIDIEKNLEKKGLKLVLAIFGDDHSPNSALLANAAYKRALTEEQKLNFEIASSGQFKGMEAPINRAPQLVTVTTMDIYYAFVDDGDILKPSGLSSRK